jgi:hypothetical protein
MKAENDRAVATILVLLLLLSWLGFAVHASPRFPGSFPGSTFGIAAGLLIVIPTIAYAVAKRSGRVRRLLPQAVPMKRLLTWHVYAALIGGLLAIVHTAHKFDSSIGIGLATALLAAIGTGYVARHFLAFVGAELREKQRWLEEAESVESVVDLEYAVAFHTTLSGRAARWAAAHRVIGSLFGVILAAHVLAAIYFGLRWL